MSNGRAVRRRIFPFLKRGTKTFLGERRKGSNWRKLSGQTGRVNVPQRKRRKQATSTPMPTWVRAEVYQRQRGWDGDALAPFSTPRQRRRLEHKRKKNCGA